MASRYLRATGNWNGAVWASSSGGAPGSAATPTAADDVHLQANYTVTLTTDVSCNSVNHTYGAIILSGHKLTINRTSGAGHSYVTAGDLNRTLDMSNSILEITADPGYASMQLQGVNLTLNTSNSLLILNHESHDTYDLSGAFHTLSKTFNDVVINLGTANSRSADISLTGSPTFRSLIIQSKNSAAHTVNFDDYAQIRYDKFVAIGTSTYNRLTLGSSDALASVYFDPKSISATTYGANLNLGNLDVLAPTADASPYYGGASSIGGKGWLLQDPPKISTLVDPLTTAPGSNSNWAVSGTVTQVTSGKDGGGYQLASGAKLTTINTYDLLDSTFNFQTLTSSSLKFNIWGYSHSLVANKFYRLALTGTTYLLQNSDDGASWTNVTSNTVDPLSYRSLRVEFEGAGTIGTINTSFNQSPTVALNTPADNTILTTNTPQLKFTGTDPDGENITYEVQYATNSSFTSPTSKLSATDTGFSGTDPYTSGVQVTYTTPALTRGGVDYYWRVRAKDPTGTNSWGAWSTARKMTTEALAPSVTSGTSSNLDTTSATVGGNVTSANGSAITERGIVYGTISTPTTANSKKTVTGTTGSFTTDLTSLNTNTTYYWRAYAINSVGTTYGAVQSFTTLPIPPTIKTGTASGTALTSFTVAGNGITSNVDSQTINEFGVVYSTTTNPTISNSSKTATGSNTNYSVTLTSLTENTTYYVKAYAKWGGTNYIYGAQITFKTQGKATVTLDTPNNSTGLDQKPQLKFTGADPDDDNLTYQLQLNSSNSFTTPLYDKLSASGGFSNLSTSKTDPFYTGNQIGYTVPDNLPYGASYYWRVRAKDVTGYNDWGVWSAVHKFTVKTVLASVSASGVHDIGFNTAQVDANVTNDGGGAVTARGVCWSISPNPTISNTKTTNGTGLGAFTANLTGLTGSTLYYVRAYATNATGTAYSAELTFTTAQTPSAPTVVTGSAVNTTDITTEFNNSDVTLDGTQPVTEKGVVFDTNPNPTVDNRKIIASTAGLGQFNVGITGLNPSTTYYARAYAINSIGTGYGNQVTFTTEAPFVPDEGDGYWTYSPDGSSVVIGRSQSTPANSSADLMLGDLDLVNGEKYTLYYSGAETDNGSTKIVLQWYEGATKRQQLITPDTPYTFTYNTSFIHWSIRLFVTNTAVASNINATFNNLYLAQEATFSGYVPFTPKGVTEIKLENNWLLDKRREETIQNIFNQIKGISWSPFDITTEGLGWFEIGDRFTITDGSESKSVVLWNSKLSIDGGISENLFTKVPDTTETNYSKAGRLGGMWRKTQIEVDKNKMEINSLNEAIYSVDGVLNTKFTEVDQSLDEVKTTVQSSGGVNLVKNSVMYAFDDDGIPDKWATTGAGTITIQASPESLSAGGISGNTFTLVNKTVTQDVTVRKDVDFITDKQYYAFSARVKKNLVGGAYIKLSNRNETHTIDLPDQEEYYWDTVKLESLLPQDDHYTVEIYSSADAALQVTDVMLSPGENTRQWTQANGEAMNTSVSITDDGMTVRSNIYRNDYTKTTALGFEVHKHEAGGERVFGFNGDETNVRKLKADNQISMSPIRIVPIDYGTYKGWAFTRTEEN